MAALVTTPVRKASELSNESPLPTPPQAMHDLIRHGRSARASHATDSNGYLADLYNHHATSYVPRGRRSVRDVDEEEQERYEGEGSAAAVARHGSSSPTLRSIMNDNERREGRLSARSSLKSIGAVAAAGATSSVKDKENVDPHASTRQARLTSDHHATLPHTATGRKSGDAPAPTSSRRLSSSTTSVADARPLNGSAFSRSTYRRSSAEQEAAAAAAAASQASAVGQADVVRRSSDEGSSSGATLVNSSSNVKRSTLRQSLNSRAEEHAAPPPPPPPSSSIAERIRESTLQTPGLGAGSRVLRSGQLGGKQTAPWSVGRSIKRIDRHTGLDKPPQRIVAPRDELEEEEEEEERPPERGAMAVLDDRSRNGSGSHRSAGLPFAPPDDVRADSGSDGSGGREVNHLQVPLGADEDEDEEDVFHDASNRMVAAARSNHEAAFRRGMRLPNGASQPLNAEPQAQRRRAAISDIMSAKVPSDAAPRRVISTAVGADPMPSAPPLESFDRGGLAAAQPTPRTVSDFMTLVRQESARQRGVPFLEQLSAKPSKDLETKFNGYKFKKIRKAGEGGFSTVWVVRGPFAAPDAMTPGGYIDVPEHDQAYFAMKQVTLKKMEQVSREEVLEECNLLQTLASKANNEDFILRFFGWKSSTGSLKILLELGEHDFNQILRAQRLTHNEIVTYWYQMLQAVHFTHEEGNIVHTDLKPANFLMANGRLKLIDFGIAQKIPVGTIHIKRDAMIGTPNYMAPETVRAVKEGRGGRVRDAAAAPGSTSRVYKAGKASDVWALGCILYQMVYNRPPFEGLHGDDKLRAILDPKHTIDFASLRYGPAKPGQCGAGGNEEDADDVDDDAEIEAVHADLLDVMRLTLTYLANERVTIPDLLRHPLLRPLEMQRKCQLTEQQRRTNGGAWLDGGSGGGEYDDDEAAETVPMSRSTLREILRKMYVYARNGELREDNIDARADALFDNMLSRHQQ